MSRTINTFGYTIRNILHLIDIHNVMVDYKKRHSEPFLCDERTSQTIDLVLIDGETRFVKRFVNVPLSITYVQFSRDLPRLNKRGQIK